MQIRTGPPYLHRELKARAAFEGTSLAGYLLREKRQYPERPAVEEMRKRLAKRQPVRPHPSPAAVVREMRESR